MCKSCMYEKPPSLLCLVRFGFILSIYPYRVNFQGRRWRSTCMPSTSMESYVTAAGRAPCLHSRSVYIYMLVTLKECLTLGFEKPSSFRPYDNVRNLPALRCAHNHQSRSYRLLHSELRPSLGSSWWEYKDRPWSLIWFAKIHHITAMIIFSSETLV